MTWGVAVDVTEVQRLAEQFGVAHNAALKAIDGALDDRAKAFYDVAYRNLSGDEVAVESGKTARQLKAANLIIGPRGVPGVDTLKAMLNYRTGRLRGSLVRRSRFLEKAVQDDVDYGFFWEEGHEQFAWGHDTGKFMQIKWFSSALVEAKSDEPDVREACERALNGAMEKLIGRP